MPTDICHDPAQASSPPNPVGIEKKQGTPLYQAATLLVMLLFLLSFWSC